MNNFVTVYELLGLIKDGKAPKKIKFCGEIFVFRNNTYEYEDGNISLFHEYKEYFAYETIEYLNDEVEVLEEDKPIIEKINLDREPLKGKEVPRAIDYLLEGRINEIIDYINRKENK